jgi:hypothetical protein
VLAGFRVTNATLHATEGRNAQTRVDWAAPLAEKVHRWTADVDPRVSRDERVVLVYMAGGEALALFAGSSAEAARHSASSDMRYALDYLGPRTRSPREARAHVERMRRSARTLLLTRRGQAMTRRAAEALHAQGEISEADVNEILVPMLSRPA